MCDYSLEQYRSRPARVGESYETYRFPSGTVGFIAPGDAFTAVCMAYDTRLRLTGVPQAVRNCCQVTADEDVTFTRHETGPYHDGVRFANGAVMTLQRLGPGVVGHVIDALLSPRWAMHTAEVV
jgi:hypothetical protein